MEPGAINYQANSPNHPGNMSNNGPSPARTEQQHQQQLHHHQHHNESTGKKNGLISQERKQKQRRNESRDNTPSPSPSPNRLPNRLPKYEESEATSSFGTRKDRLVGTEGTMSMPIIEDPALIKGNS